MINSNSIDNVPYQPNDPAENQGMPFKQPLRKFGTILGIPILQFLMALFGIVMSLSTLIIAYSEVQDRIDETKRSVDSMYIVIDSLKVHVNRGYNIQGLRDRSIKYDTVLIPHEIIEDLNKFGSPGNQR